MQTSCSVVARCLIDSLTHDGILRLLPAYTPFFAPNHSFPELPTDQQHASHQQSSVLTAVHRAAADAAVCCCILVCCLGRDMPVTLPYAWKSIVWTKFDIQDGSIVWLFGTIYSWWKVWHVPYQSQFSFKTCYKEILVWCRNSWGWYWAGPYK